ncbi:SubName: Full=Related to RSM7-mitochondrial ribosomal protein, small subunit {ECO:0000313/EMBL:CCA69153.1} [Serendipita indica DSM 11827]|nr:SubName: Full=Related to RSM7-mitochondrial ribosomal protein, small subunit {ECO:0000313/EMBL:CCA69153.1} [Serendipita indica DSM 11827]
MLAEIHKLTNAPALPIFRQAVDLASPSVRLRSQKKNAKSSLIPTPLNDRQRTFFAVKWLLAVSKNRSEKKIEERLAKEVVRIIEGESEVLRKKTEMHKLAVANRSNATFKPGRA